jgi:adenylate cyclase
MITELRRWNQERVAAGKLALDMGVGINTDKVVSGNIGSPKRMDYTIIGDGVNLASRLEGLCKQYDALAIVSQSVVDEAGRAFAFRRLDRVAVKGRAEGLMVYELLGASADLAAARAYESAFDDYLRGDFAAAIARLELHPGDGPSRVLARRCGELLSSPPPATWNGVHVAASK